MSRSDDTPDADGGFLGRWAKRKQEAQRETEPKILIPSPSMDEPASSETPPSILRQAQDEGSITAAAEASPMPSLDSIVPGGDVSAFFQKHVPEALRTAALRKLWVTDPEIKGFIEMADYQWDFNNPDSIPGWSSTVGSLDVKAMMERVMGGNGPLAGAGKAVEQGEKPTEISAEGADAVPSEPRETVCENTETAIISASSQNSDGVSDLRLIQNGASQNSTKESSVYDVVRKRGGGALPT